MPPPNQLNFAITPQRRLHLDRIRAQFHLLGDREAIDFALTLAAGFTSGVGAWPGHSGPATSAPQAPVLDATEGGEDILGHEQLTLTTRLQEVLAHARSEARRLNHDAVGAEHLLLGLLCDEWGKASEFLARNNISLSRMRAAVAARRGRGEGVLLGELAPDKTFRRALNRAAERARDQGVRYIGTEHLLPALLSDDAIKELLTAEGLPDLAT